MPGTVGEIDDDSPQLRDALEGEQARIVITTLQKFPYVLRKLTGERRRRSRTARYAVIVDEAHSSQTGQTAVDLKAVLGSKTIEDLDLDEEEVDGVPPSCSRRSPRAAEQPNISYFAFTATPEGHARSSCSGRAGADGGTHARSTPTRCARRSRRASSSTCCATTRPTTSSTGSKTRPSRRSRCPRARRSRSSPRSRRFHPYAKDQKAEGHRRPLHATSSARTSAARPRRWSSPPAARRRSAGSRRSTGTSPSDGARRRQDPRRVLRRGRDHATPTPPTSARSTPSRR